MPIPDDTQRWLLLPTPRPLAEAPPAVQRSVQGPRTILRWLGAGLTLGLAAIVSETLYEAALAALVMGGTFGLPLAGIGEHLARRNRRRCCDGPVTRWQVEAVRPCTVVRSRSDGAWWPARRSGEALVRPPRSRFISRPAVEARLFDPLGQRRRFTCDLPAAPGEEIPVIEAADCLVVFFGHTLLYVPHASFGERPSALVRYASPAPGDLAR